MQTLKFISPNHKLNYLSPLPLIGDADSQFRMSDSTIETDNSSSSSPRQDFDWCSRRSSPITKSDHFSEDDEDDDVDEVLSVGCESPPPCTPSPSVAGATTTDNLKKKALSEGQQALKFSIDNILRPEFGDARKQKTSSKKRSAADDSPVDLSKECCDTKNGKTESRVSSPTSENNNMMWPAWVYCTRYSDRPSSGK